MLPLSRCADALRTTLSLLEQIDITHACQVKELVAIPTKAVEEVKIKIEAVLPTPPKVSS